MKCFLAANSAEGFVSEFGSCYDPTSGWRAHIIKGGPGTGKSSFMRKVLKHKNISDNTAIEVYCASDPDSLDAVILPKIKMVIMDGTAPHIVEPRMPGIGDSIIDFGMFWDEEKLKSNSREIIAATKKNKAFHNGASRYIKAAGELISMHLEGKVKTADNKSYLSRCEEIIERFIPKKSGFGRGNFAFLYGITPKGIVSFAEDIPAQNKITIGDSFSLESQKLLDALKNSAIERGYETVVFKNPILPSQLTDGIFIPELSLFIHKTKNISDDPVVSELLNRASDKIKKAKLLHDELEGYYISAMDFEALNKFTDSFIRERL